MIDHSGITVSDFKRSKEFYAAVLNPLGYIICKDFGTVVGYGVPAGFGASHDPGGDFWISAGAPSSPRPHFAFSAQTREAVDAFHLAALVAGATDNGGPGPAADLPSRLLCGIRARP